MKIARRLNRIIGLFIITITFSSCHDIWGALDNPADPDSSAYQGYETVANLDELAIVSPTAGSTLAGTNLVVTPVVGATAYAVRIAATETALGETNLYEKSDYSTNILDVSAVPLFDGTTYWWQVQARGADVSTWGAWSSAVSFTTDWSTPTTTPAFSPEGGTYTSDQSVTISCAISVAQIYYTTDGSTPTTSSTEYTTPISVAGHGTTKTIKALATAAGYSTSDVKTEAFVIDYYATATPTFSPASGTYASDQSVTISCTTAGSTIYYTTDGGTPTTSSTPYSAPSSVAGHGTSTTIKALAIASGYSTSGVGSGMYTISYPAAATPTFSPASGTYNSDQSVTISSATAGATIYYTTDGGTPTTSSTPYSAPISVAGHETSTTIKALAIASGYSTSGVGSGTYTISYPAAATPTFSPASGTYSSDQSVTISCATSGATIYFTTGGATPTTLSTLYMGAIEATISGSGTTIKAIATAPGYSTSAEGSATYKDHYDIGDIGPAGGIVFYDKGSYSSGWRYLEAAPSDHSTWVLWNNGSNVTTGATATGIGSGAANTATIVSVQGAGTYAASVCADLSIGGYEDWFLPSMDELNLMYAQKGIIGGLSSSISPYYSSSETASWTAWVQYFSSGNQDAGYYKDYGGLVRAIRAF